MIPLASLSPLWRKIEPRMCFYSQSSIPQRAGTTWWDWYQIYIPVLAYRCAFFSIAMSISDLSFFSEEDERSPRQDLVVVDTVVRCIDELSVPNCLHSLGRLSCCPFIGIPQWSISRMEDERSLDQHIFFFGATLCNSRFWFSCFKTDINNIFFNTPSPASISQYQHQIHQLP